MSSIPGKNTYSYFDMHLPEFFNMIKILGLLNHQLYLKAGVPVMLMRNIDQSFGLCNETRLIVIEVTLHVKEKLISRSKTGEIVYIPQMLIVPSNSRLPFKFQHSQFFFFFLQ